MNCQIDSAEWYGNERETGAAMWVHQHLSLTIAHVAIQSRLYQRKWNSSRGHFLYYKE